MIKQAIYNKRNKRLIEYLIVVAVLMLFEIAIMIRYHYRLALPYYLITLASMSLLPGFIFFVKSSKKRFVLYSILVFFAFAFFVTNTCLFYYKEDIFAFAMILDIADGIKMGIKYNIFIAFNGWQWLLIISSLITSIILLYKFSVGKHYDVSAIPKRNITIFLCTIFVLLFATGFIYEKDLRIYEVPQDKRTHLTTFGMTTFAQRDFFTTLGSYITKNTQRLQAIELLKEVDHTTLTPNSTMFSTMQDKNVIMIMLETVEEYAVDPILTPTLHELLYGGYHFNNTYGVAKTNYTYDAEFKSLTSMMYYQSSNLMHMYAKNEFTNALPHLLRTQGYTANAFHSYDREYFNRDTMYKALGFSHFYANDEMTFSEVDFWPLDSEFLGQMTNQIAPVQDELFFSFIITLSTHGSFVQRRTEFAPYYTAIHADGRFDLYEEEFITQLAAHMDLDKGLHLLVEDLTAKELLDDTMIVLFSDHKNYSSPEIMQKYKQDIVTLYDYDRIPFSIYNPAIAATSINDVCSQYDIMPTMLDLLGIRVIKDYYYGQSVFLSNTSDYEERPIIIGYNRWIEKNIVVYDKQILYLDDSISDVDAYYVDIQSYVFDTIEKFHAFFLTDYFRKTAIE